MDADKEEESLTACINSTVQEKIEEIFKFGISVLKLDDVEKFEDDLSLEHEVLHKLLKERHWLHYMEFFIQMLELLNDEASHFAIWGEITTKIDDVTKHIKEFLNLVKSYKHQQEEETINKIGYEIRHLQTPLQEIFGENCKASQVFKAKVSKMIEDTFGRLENVATLKMNVFSGEVSSTSFFEEFQKQENEEVGSQIVDLISENKWRFFDMFALFIEIANLQSDDEDDDDEENLDMENFQKRVIKLKKLLKSDPSTNEENTNYYEEIGYLGKNIQKFFEEEFLEDTDMDEINDLVRVDI